MAKLDKAVTESPDGWDFACPVTDGSCGPEPFTSTGWPTKKLALLRAQQHIAEHIEGASARAEGREVDPAKRAPSLEEFRTAHGIAVTADGKAVLTAEDFV